MDHEPLTYYEKLENVFILMETKNMLEEKLKELKANHQSTVIVEDDLRKIEEEIEEYTDGVAPNPNQMTVTALFNPGVFELEE
jgi:ribosome recycling factor